jgi:hypothetical protein
MPDTRYAYRWVEGRHYFVPAHHYGPGPYEHERPTLEEAVALVQSWPETDPDHSKPQRRGYRSIEERMVVRERRGEGVDGLVDKSIARYELDGTPKGGDT